MKPILRVLIVEDSDDDTLLLVHQLKKNNFSIEHKRVDTADAFEAALKEHEWDIILSDFKMPHFSGSEALEIYKKFELDIPFIIVSGTIGEETAVAAMKAGAHDYIMKNNFKRLLPSIEREVRESKNRAERKRLELEQKIAEESVKQSAVRLNEAQRIAHVGSWELDLRTNILLWSDEIYRIFEIDPQRFGASYEAFLNLIHPEDRDAVNAAYTNSVKSKTPYTIDHRLLFPDGRIKFVHERCETFYGDDGAPLRSLGTVQDITKQKEAEEHIRLANEEWERTFNAITDPIMILDKHHRVIKANKIMEAVFDNKSELMGLPCYEAVHGTSSPPDFCPHSLLLKDGCPHAVEIFEQRLGGSFIVSVSPLLTPDGALYGSIHIARNITDRKLMEQALSESELKYRKIFENVQDIFYQTDLAGIITEISPSIERYSEYTRADLLGKPVTSVYHNPKDRDRLLQIIKEKGEVVDYELQLKSKLGRLIYASVNAHILYDKEGKLAGTEGSLRDITERKKAEREMIMLSQAIKNVSECVSVTDEHDIILFVNTAFLDTYGYTKEELVGKNISMVRSEKNTSAVVAEILPSTLRGTWEGEVMNKRKDGSEFLVHLSTTSVRDDRNNIIALIGVAKDITEQRKAEEALRESEERYRNLFEQDSNGSYITTVEGELIDCNPAFLKIFGFHSKEEAIATNITSIYKTPEQRKDFIELLRSKKRIEGMEFEFQHKNGTTVYAIKNAIGIFDQNDALIKIQGYIIDDTERRVLRQQLIQSQKIESLGVLAGGIAHDFNNILGIILGYISMLRMGTYTREQLQAWLETITNAIDRGAGLVKQILTFARKTDVMYGLVDANSMIKEFIKMLQETFPKNIAIESHLADQPLPTVLDETQLHQALLNLTVNARDAMPQGGTLTITTKLVAHDILQSKVPEAADDQYLCISVSDTGTGMDNETKRRIFEPFFTTKEKGKGTGLGLPVVYGIVKSHKGFLTLDSKVGTGTTFYLYIPFSATAEAMVRQKDQAEEEIQGGTETILLVEDEEALIYLIQMLLETKGYRVLTAGDGVEAVEFFRHHKNEIDLVVSDIGLPRLTGDQVFLQMKEINPNVKTILASGYLEAEKKSELLQAGAKNFIQKPYEPGEILKTIRSVLDM